MKIKDEYDLANVLGMAFAAYANRVARGEVVPFLRMISGDSEVAVTVSLRDDGSVAVAPFVEVVQKIAESPPEAEVLLVEPVASMNILIPVVEEKPKPKRKRKKKTEVTE